MRKSRYIPYILTLTLNIDLFFEKTKKATNKYEKFIIMGNFNIDLNSSGSHKKIRIFLWCFKLTNLICNKPALCKDSKSTIDY